MANPNWKKGGKSGNPKGRPPIILPEVQRVIDGNRNSLKLAIIEKVAPHVEQWIQRIIEQGVAEGDIVRFKMLLEMALGKLAEDKSEFVCSTEEQDLVTEYRRLKKEQIEKNEAKTLPDSTKASKESLK